MQVLPGLPAAMWLNALKASTRNWPLTPSLMGMFFNNAISSLKKEGPVNPLRGEEPNRSRPGLVNGPPVPKPCGTVKYLR